LEELQKNEAAYNLINQLKSQKNNQEYQRALKIKHIDVNDFIINTEEIIKVESEFYTSFTLPIYRDYDTNLTENLVVSLEKDNTYKSYIITYNFTLEEQQDIINNIFFDLDNKVAIQALDDFDISNVLSKETITKEADPCDPAVSRATGWVIELYDDCDEGSSGSEDTNENEGTIDGSSGIPSNTDPSTDPNCDTCTAGGGGSGSNTEEESNPIYTVPTVPTESIEDIVFNDFIKSLQISQQIFINDSANETLKEQLFDFLSQNISDETSPLSYSNDSESFADVAIDVLMENNLLINNEVDFIEKIIYTINKECQEQIVKGIISTSSTFTDMIKNTFNDSQILSVKFWNGDLPGGNPAHTNPFIENNIVSIGFDDDYLDTATNLSIMSATLHELTHAYFIALYNKGSLAADNDEFNTLLNSYVAFFEEMTEDTFTTLDNEIHNAMFFFIVQMAQSLYAYTQANDMSTVTLEYCQKLAWGSMYGTNLFNEMLTEDQRIEYGNIAAAEQDNLEDYNPKGTPCEE